MMKTYSIDLPEQLHHAADEFAREAGLTMDQLVASAVAEKVSALAGPAWLAERAKRGNRVLFDEALSRVADVEPEERDRR